MIGLTVGLECIRGHKIEVLKSGAGYYIGTRDNDGFPNCRISMFYAPTEIDALRLVEDRSYASEVKYCNHCMGCFKSVD